MRLVIQRVTSAQVSTTERGVIGAIGIGLCVLVGIGHGDGDKEVEWAIKNLLNIKFWPNDEDKPWKVDVASGGHSVLLVSQFTLYGQVYKKGRLDFHNAMPPTDARMLYDKLVGDMRRTIGESRTQSGEFGAMMEVRFAVLMMLLCKHFCLPDLYLASNEGKFRPKNDQIPGQIEYNATILNS